MTPKELRIKRIRNGISAKELARYLDVSYGWLRQVELYYRGPSIKNWLQRYEDGLNDLITIKRGKGQSGGEER